MRIIHTADIHLGARPDAGFPWEKDREKSIRDAFMRILQTAYDEKPDLLIIAGDLFHKPPKNEELKEINRLFSLIPDTAVVLCAGNHDFINAEENYKKFKWGSNVYGLWSKNVESISIPEKDVRVYGCSYYSKTEEYDLYEDAAPEGDETFHILVAHGGDEKHSPFNVDALKNSDFDYIALGHIHKPGSLVQDKAVYPGGPEPLDKTETGRRGFVKVELEKGKKNNVRFIPCSEYTYETINLYVNSELTDEEITERISEEVKNKGEKASYTLHIAGTRPSASRIRLDRLWNIGHFIEIIDDTMIDYDVDALLEKYQDSLLSSFILSFDENMRPEEKIALDVGIRAILSAKNNGEA